MEDWRRNPVIRQEKAPRAKDPVRQLFDLFHLQRQPNANSPGALPIGSTDSCRLLGPERCKVPVFCSTVHWSSNTEELQRCLPYEAAPDQIYDIRTQPQTRCSRWNLNVKSRFQGHTTTTIPCPVAEVASIFHLRLARPARFSAASSHANILETAILAFCFALFVD
ncbi:hypothetical protein BJX68DRAFT_105611 [Aspergillus pseudodeflectus]|uniref:Uncharacterized protein n=1 Tax=Aspergillus pseudodeflectus TaxID=176178 RepID=A0ABR4K842_9EURO